MEEKNELSDIILDNNKKGGDTNKTKKILFLAIILILIFIFVIIGMKISNKPQTKKNNFNIVLPPEPTTKIKPKKEELFKQVPIVEENGTKEKDNFNAMVEKLKNKEKLNKETPKQPIQQTQKSENPTPKDVKTTQNDKKITKKESNKAIPTSNIYIQVGVTFKTKPSKKYLKKIKTNGYLYRLYTLKISGKNATKILIGPYKSRKDAKKEMPKIKQKINKAAFIYVIK